MLRLLVEAGKAIQEQRSGAIKSSQSNDFDANTLLMFINHSTAGLGSLGMVRIRANMLDSLAALIAKTTLKGMVDGSAT